MLRKLFPLLFGLILILAVPTFAASKPKNEPGQGKGGTASAKAPKGQMILTPMGQIILIRTAPKDYKGTLATVGKHGEILIPKSTGVSSAARSAAPPGAQQPSVAASSPQTTGGGGELTTGEDREKKKSRGSGEVQSASGTGIGDAKGASDSSLGDGFFGGGGGTLGGLGDNSGAGGGVPIFFDSGADTSVVNQGGGNNEIPLPPTMPTAQLQALLNQSVSDNGVPGMVMAVQTKTGTFIGAAGKADLGDAASGRDPQAMTADMQVRLGGVTKLFSAALIMKLVEQKIINLDDTMDILLGEGAVPTGPNGEPVTVRMLLNHTGGVPDHETTQEFLAGANGLLAFPTLPWDPFVNILPLIESFPSTDFVPGSDFKYSNSGYYLLGMITEATTSSLLEDTIKTLFFDPLGLSQTALPFSGLFNTAAPFTRSYSFLGFPQFPTLEDTTDWDLSYDWTSGSGVSTAQDMLTFTEALFGSQVVSRDSLQQMTTPQSLTTSHGPLTFGYGLEVVASDPWFGEKVYRSDGETTGAFARWLYYPSSGRIIFIAMNRCDKRFNTAPPLDSPPDPPQVDASKKADDILVSASKLLIQAQAQ